jgi:3'(2'), 5'-bisphosphate nucleotidase
VSAQDDSRMLEVLLEITREAAEIVNEVYATPFEVEYKGPRDPVTLADRRANDLICARLAEHFPDVPIVAEESDPKSFADFRAAPRVFFVDPLDGTREFVDRNGEFVVMIGLVEGDRARAGVILAPAQNECWAGEVGRGAWRLDENGARAAIHVSDLSELAQARIVASRSHRTEDVERALELLGVGSVLALGSAGLKGVAVARGAAEAYVAPLYAGKRWDACACDAIVTAAGGRLSDAFGAPIDYRAESLGNDRGLVASNGQLHEALLATLERIRAAEG